MLLFVCKFSVGVLLIFELLLLGFMLIVFMFMFKFVFVIGESVNSEVSNVMFNLVFMLFFVNYLFYLVEVIIIKLEGIKFVLD